MFFLGAAAQAGWKAVGDAVARAVEGGRMTHYQAFPVAPGRPKRPLAPKAIERLRARLLRQIQKAAQQDPAFAEISGKARQLWAAAHESSRRSELLKAARDDRGVVL